MRPDMFELIIERPRGGSGRSPKGRRKQHARTRPDDTAPDPRVRWLGLEVLDVVDGGPDDAEGVVEFRARWVSADDGPVRRGELHERSRFTRRAGRWVYVEAERPRAST